MSIDDEIAELCRERDAMLQRLNRQSHEFAQQLEERYSPVRLLQRHLGAAMAALAAAGVAAGSGLLSVGTGVGGTWLNRLKKILAGESSDAPDTQHSHHAAAQGVSKPSSGGNGEHSADDDAAETEESHPVIAFVEPLVRQAVVGLASNIAWRDLLLKISRKSRRE